MAISDSGDVHRRRWDGRPWNERWDERYSAADFNVARPPSQFIETEPGALPPGRALELAAGAGRHTVWLAGRGWRVTAVDFSRAGLALNRSYCAARGVDESLVDWVVADLSDYEPERGAYGLALICNFQASWAVQARARAGAAAALAVGGTALVLGYDLANLTEGTGGHGTPMCCTPRRPPPRRCRVSGRTGVQRGRSGRQPVGRHLDPGPGGPRGLTGRWRRAYPPAASFSWRRSAACCNSVLLIIVVNLCLAIIQRPLFRKISR